MFDDGYPTKVPTDPHEDKWNRMAVSSKKNDMKSVDIDERLDDYINFSRHNLSAGLSFQNQAFKDVSKQDDKLKSFNQKILREFDDLKRMRYFPNQQHRFPVSNEPVASSFIINPEQIAPTLKASEDRIKALETEMDHRERDMMKMNGIVDLLIEENKYLRDHISAKNRDISKILETVGLNDGETTHDLRHRLSLLSEENNILLAHLEELRAVKENFEKYTREKYAELNKAAEDYHECRQSLEEALKREELLTNYKQMMDPKFRHSQEKIAELEATVSDLVEELSQVKNQNVLMSNQVASYKKSLEELDGKNVLELDRLVQEVNVLQNEKKEHKKTIEAKDKVLEDRQNELKKVRRDFETTKLEFEEVVQIMNELKNQLANERQTTEISVKREKELRERNNHLADELEKFQGKVRKHEDEHVHMLESLKLDHTTRTSKYETKIQKLKYKLDDKDKKYKAEIAALKTQSEDLARILESVSAEREDYFKRWEALSREAHLFGERERLLEDLEKEVERLSKELEKYRREVMDTEQRYRAQNDDLRSESDKLNEINKQLREELAELKRYLEEDHHPVREKDTRHLRDSSTKAGTVETTRRRELVERDQNVVTETTKRNVSASPTKRESRSVTELQKENEYLHQMIKNLVQSEDNHGAQISTVRPSHTERAGYQANISPLRTPDTRVYMANVREARLIEEPRPVEHIIHHEPVEVMHRPVETIVHRPVEHIVHHPVEHVVHRPVEHVVHRPVEHVVHRPVEHVVLREEFRPVTPVHHTTTAYPMRTSMTASQYERAPRASVTYTDVKQKENANVDTVISGILKKYNMEQIPDYVGKSKGIGGPSGEYIKRDAFESTRDGHVSHVAQRADLGGSVRSPQMQFLSPLLSSPKYESKTESLSNSVSKPELRRDKILSPEAIDVIETIKRDMAH